jgi:hypothetical protein
LLRVAVLVQLTLVVQAAQAVCYQEQHHLFQEQHTHLLLAVVGLPHLLLLKGL